MKEEFCIICGKKFEAKGKQKICSKECRKERDRLKQRKSLLKNKKIVLQKRICPICGEEFETYSTRQFLCGKESCKQKNIENYRRNNRESINNKRKIRHENNKDTENLQNKIRREKNRINNPIQPRNKKEVVKEVVIQTCAICGSLFVKKRINQKVCGNKKCKKTYNLIYVRKYKTYQRKLKKDIDY